MNEPQTAFDRSKPVHFFHHEQQQFRLEVQRFSNCPPELKVKEIDFAKHDVPAYEAAYRSGASSCFRKRGVRTAPAVQSEEDLQRSMFRAKKRVRLLVKELGPNHFSTFSTREKAPYMTAEDWKVMWGYFVRFLRLADIDFQYVAVLERHPSNPEHLHMHVAWRGKGFVNYNMLRRFWHMAIGKHRGFKVTRVLRGDDSPGNVQDRQVKASAGSYRHTEKIAKYIGKYITKDLISDFNKKRYWQSSGISVAETQVFWLSALSMPDALREGLGMFGLWDSGADAPLQNPWVCREGRVAWLAMDPKLLEPPF